jgi:hypothetical protein
MNGLFSWNFPTFAKEYVMTSQRIKIERPHGAYYEHCLTFYRTHQCNRCHGHSVRVRHSLEPARCKPIDNALEVIHAKSLHSFVQSPWCEVHSTKALWDRVEDYSFTGLRILGNICRQSYSWASSPTGVDASRCNFVHILEQLRFAGSRVTNQ